MLSKEMDKSTDNLTVDVNFSGLEMLQDELTDLHSAYANANKEIRNLKEQNENLINNYDATRRTLLNIRNSLKKTDAEVIRLTETNYKLTKSNAKIQRKSAKLGSELLKAKNEIRSLGGNWKQFNKEERKNG